MRILFVYLCACVSVCVFMCVCVCIYVRAYFYHLRPEWVGSKGRGGQACVDGQVSSGSLPSLCDLRSEQKNNPLIVFSSPLSLFAIHACKFFCLSRFASHILN